MRAETLLKPLGEVRTSEVRFVLLALSSLFTLLCSYYLLKTAREPLILADGGSRLRAYSSALQALLLLAVVPAYAWASSKFPRERLVLGMTGVFFGCVALFAVGAFIGVPYLGIAFFVWTGLFSSISIAQFWSLANDLVQSRQGERLFPVIALGATGGSWVGSALASLAFRAHLSAATLLAIGAGLLAVHGALYWGMLRARPTKVDVADERPLSAGSGFGTVLRSPYLRWIALLMVSLNVVNTLGEFVVSSYVETAADAAATAAGGSAAEMAALRERFTGLFYGDYYVMVNVATMLLQAFVVSRLARWGGLRVVVLALPLVALASYSLIAAGVSLALVRMAKIAENSVDYSIANTAKAMFWLPTTREQKYQAKQAIDSFFVRGGDVLAGLLVYLVVELAAQTPTTLAILNLGLLAVAIFVATRVATHYERAMAGRGDPPAPSAEPKSEEADATSLAPAS